MRCTTTSWPGLIIHDLWSKFAGRCCRLKQGLCTTNLWHLVHICGETPDKPYIPAILKSKKEQKGVKDNERESKHTQVSQRDRATPHNLRKCAQQPGAKGVETSERELNAAKRSWLGLGLGIKPNSFSLVFALVLPLYWGIWAILISS